MTATLDDDRITGAVGEAGPGDEPPAEPPAPPRPIPAPLAPWVDPHPRVGWVLTLVIAIFAGVTRFWALGFPPGANTLPNNGYNFDEVYYAPEASELLRYGYEDNRGYLFIVHPPLGKWLIGGGEWLTGLISGHHSTTAYLTDSFGWRLGPAVFGTLTVIVVMRIARRITRSNVLGFIGGLLMACEGMSLVLGRTAILDIFLQFFVIAAFGALVLDRERTRARLGALVAAGADLTSGAPTLGPRPWRVAAGVLIGLAGSVKWTALSFYLAFFILSWCWDHGMLKSAGVRRPTANWLRRAVLPGLGSLVLLPWLAYLFCNLGWFAGENGWNRHWADTHGHYGPFPGALGSLAQSTHQAYTFHEGLDSPHAYGSNPWSWWVLGRPVNFYYDGASTACGSGSGCSRQVLLVGTPLEWWAFIPVVLWLAWHWITTRDWRAGSVLLAIGAGWLVWFQDLSRTKFLFYMAPLVPFLILGLTVALGVLLGPPVRRRLRVPLFGAGVASREGAGGVTDTGIHTDIHTGADGAAVARRRWGVAGVSVFLALVVVDFAWMWPILTGGLISYSNWHAHMWLPSWV